MRLCVTRDNAHRSSVFYTDIFDLCYTDIFTEEKVDMHVKINQGRHLIDVPLSTGDCCPETFFDQATKVSPPTFTFFHVHAPEVGPMVETLMASAFADAVDKQFGGGRDSLGDSTQLHHSFICSNFQ